MLESRQEKSNKKILILTNYDVGLYQFRRELLTEMIRCGNKVYISLPYGDLVPELKKMGCEFIDTPLDRRGIDPKTDYHLYRFYRKLIHKIQPDLVITYTIKPNIYGGYACRKEHVPYAANVTGLGTAFQKDGMLKKMVVFMYKAAFKKIRTVFFENESNQDVFLKLGICEKSKTIRLNGAGVNTEHYSYLPYPNNKEVIFLFIGRIMKEKGIDELFEAMKRLHEEGYPCKLNLLGDFEEHYENVIQKYQRDGWLEYYGFCNDVRPYIQSADCFVLPSWHEGMANTNLECASSGRPIITSDIPGCREAVLESQSGLLCEAKNADSLYKTMKQFLSMSVEEREEMGRAGRVHMLDVFDKKQVVSETMKGLGL